MAAIGNVSVTSAAIIEGSLIIGLSDGSIINCGYVQGPQGLKGDRGPTGATGERGTDGATIHTTKGPPPADLGKDGDYAINNRDWFIFGPKASGMWGAGQGMLPKDIHQPVLGGSSNQGGGPIGGTDSGGGGGGSTGPVWTNQVFTSATGRFKSVKAGSKITVEYPGGPNGILEPSPKLDVQSNVNAWIVDALEELEAVIPVEVVADLPDAGKYQGDMVLFEGALYIWAGDVWNKVSAEGGAVIDTVPPVPAEKGQLWFNNSEDELTLYIYDGAVWVPASPPVSLDGINSAIANVDAELMKVNANIAMNKRDIDEAVLDFRESQDEQDKRLDALEADGGGDFLPTAGGELKGTLQINGSMDGKIDPLLCRADGYYMTFGVTKTGEVLAGSSPALPFLAVDGWHVVTKGYLDSRLPEQGLFHETWWTYRASADRSDCEKGEFCADSTDFFMSDKNEDNHSWGPSVSGGRTTQAFVTIYSSDGKLCHTYEVNKIHFHEKYTKKYITEFDWTWSHISNALVDGAKYKIVVPGFLT